MTLLTTKSFASTNSVSLRLELIAMSALAVYANILADATAMKADAMLHSFWDSKKCRGCSAVLTQYRKVA